MNLTRMIRALVFAMLASALVYAVMLVVSDGPEAMRALGGFDPGVLAAMLALSLGCYVLRSLRWGWLLRLSGHPVSVRDALYLNMSGQTMSISPGRVGEILKPWLSREVSGLSMARGMALVFSERVADLIAVSLLSLGGLTAIGIGTWPLLVGLALIALGVAVVSSEWFHRLALGVLAKQRWAKKHGASAEAISQTVRASLAWKVLGISTLYSVAAWGLEGIGFWLCVRELGFDAMGLLAGLSIYAVATIIGAFTFLPGGIGLTEASMAGILVAIGMGAAGASAATLLTRVVTLWWAVLLGWIMLGTRPSLFRKLLARSSEDAA